MLIKRFTFPSIGPVSIAMAALILVLATIAIDRLAEAGLKHLLLQSSYRYMRVYKSAPPARYLVIGNSRAGVHFPSGTKGDIEFFNLGNGGMGVAFAAALAADYVDHYGPPKVAIIEMSFVTDPRLGEEAAGLTRVFSHRARAIGRNVPAFQEVAEQAFHLLRFNHPTLLNALVGLFWERTQRAAIIQISDATIRHIEQLAPFELAPDPDNVERMATLVAWLRQRGVAVVCVLSPVLPQMTEKTINLDSYVTALRSLAESNGAVFLDHMAMISNFRLFSDAAHLNNEGVQKFDQVFFAQLAAQRL